MKKIILVCCFIVCSFISKAQFDSVFVIEARCEYGIDRSYSMSKITKAFDHPTYEITDDGALDVIQNDTTYATEIWFGENFAFVTFYSFTFPDQNYEEKLKSAGIEMILALTDLFQFSIIELETEKFKN